MYPRCEFREETANAMIVRTTKVLLMGALALLHTLVVFNNVTDFGANYEFVRHVLRMDTTFPGNHAHWRAIATPGVQVGFYVAVIVWEAAVAVLLWWGAARLARSLRGTAPAFNSGKGVAAMGMGLSLLLWLVAFLCVGGEWFLMWQSQRWNGQEEAFRMFAVVALVLLIVLREDAEGQP